MHSIDLDVASALAPPRTCPACGADGLLPISDTDSVRFTCPGCQRCWRLELGIMVLVERDRCPVSAQDPARRTNVPTQRDTP